MTKHSRNRRKVPSKRNRGPRRGPRLTDPARHLTALPMTDNLFVKLRWSDDTTITSLSSWRFGLAQFWNQIPGYYSQYMTIYKMSRIVKTHVRVTVINTTANTPAEIVLCRLPFSDYSKTLAQVKQLPKCKFKFLSGSGGLDKASLSYTDTLNSAVGVDSRSIRDYQQSASEAASTLALLPDTPIIALYVGGASTEPTLRVFIEVDYHVEFFLPEYPGSLLVDKDKDRDVRVPVDRTSKVAPVRLLTRRDGPRSQRDVDEDTGEDSWSKAPRSRK